VTAQLLAQRVAVDDEGAVGDDEGAVGVAVPRATATWRYLFKLQLLIYL